MGERETSRSVHMDHKPSDNKELEREMQEVQVA